MAGKSIIVTGGASGMGRSATLLLAKQGCAVTIADLDAAGAAETIAMVERAGSGKASFVRTNLVQEEDVRALVDRANAFGGPISGALNAAGMYPTHASALHEISADDWDVCNNVNLKAMFFCFKYQITSMLKTGGGSIVAIASAAAVIGQKHDAEYCAAKAGVLGLVRAAAIEYATQGIRVNAILPGATLTPMTTRSFAADPHLEGYAAQIIPMKRMAQVEEVAAGCVWLLSDEASYTTGVSLPIDGGLVAA